MLNRYRDKVVEITYGLDKSTYPSPAPDTMARWRLKFGEGQRFFLFVGMLRYYKGASCKIAERDGFSGERLIRG